MHRVIKLRGYTPPLRVNEAAARKAASLWIWLPFYCLLSLFLVFLGTQGSSYILTKSYRITPGIFVKNMHEHNFFRYRFQVANRIYQGESSSSQHNADDVENGAAFDGYYYPRAPGINSAERPRKVGALEWELSLFVAGMITILLRSWATNLAGITTLGVETAAL